MKRISLFLFALIIPLISRAENNVSVVSFGTAVIEEQAIQNALRNAIEQAFGTFVSANTVIINDVLVSDEIATITRGNVKSYDVLSTTINDGQYTVNIRVTVSLDNLISFAQSKGSISEFDGKAFSSNIKMMQFRAENATKALEIMVKQVDLLSHNMFDYELELQDPIRIHTQSRMLGLEYDTTLDGYLIPIDIILKNNITSSSVYKLVTSTIEAITISEEEAERFRKLGLPVCDNIVFEKTSDPYNRMRDSWSRLGYLPISKDYYQKISQKISLIYLKESINYKIVTQSATPQEYVWEKWKKGRNIYYYGNQGSKVLSEDGHLNYPYSIDRTFWLIPSGTSSKRFVYQDSFIDARLGICNLKFINPSEDIDPLQKMINDRDSKYMQDLTFQLIHTSFYINEQKTVIEPSPKEKKDINKRMKNDPNYVYIPKYDIKYSDQQELMRVKAHIYIPANEMPTFKGVIIEHR